MLTDEQILHLLARCEVIVGRTLWEIRSNLASQQWAPFLWELVVLEAAGQIADVTYESSTPGGNKPDLRLDFCGQGRIWIEVAFLVADHGQEVLSIDCHPVFRSLRRKGEKATKANTSEPHLVCLGTDRVWKLGQSHNPREPRRDDVVASFFEQSSSLAGVLLVPVLPRPKAFVGVEREAHPTLIINPAARSPLSAHLLELINHLDFDRWKYSTWTDRSKVRGRLRKAIRDLDGRTVVPPPIDPYWLPPESSSLPSPAWCYHWRFNHLRIACMGDRYWLLRGSSVAFEATSAEKAAEIAATLYQPASRYVWGSNGIEPHPDRGVPSELDQWTLELG